MTLALPKTYRPLAARIVSAVAGLSLVIVLVAVWVLLPHEIQQDFSTFQRITLLVVLAGMFAALYAIFRTACRVDESGLTVVNGFRSTRYDWEQVVRISLGRNRAWALLDLDDGTTASVVALQTADGPRAQQAVRELAAELDRHV